MRTIADTALQSVVGLVVLAAMFVAIWVARDSGALAGVTATDADAKRPVLQSARTHRDPVRAHP